MPSSNNFKVNFQIEVSFSNNFKQLKAELKTAPSRLYAQKYRVGITILLLLKKCQLLL